ncbi:MAG: beta-galactosidase [Oscillospiraceae bacterium]|nr:beta-galactosidase [Oscillospiraceae bacterium]
MDKRLDFGKLTLGTCYYPEHWPEELWRSDIDRMLENGISVIRIAEFAWNKFEPEEDIYDMSFFDRFLDVAEQTPIKVIFCTPTATPPAWLTDRYPEVLNAFIDGTLIQHGLRRHYNYNSPVYLEKTADIVRRIARHYGKRKCIIGWQIDNEFNCESTEFYSESDHYAFREYVKAKYLTLDKLNEAWGTAFWNQTYTDWSQVYLPRPTANGIFNPHQQLEAKGFWSHSVREYCALQSRILRENIPAGQFITHNGFFGHLDSHAMTQESLDFLTYDSYPNFAYVLDFNSKNPMKDRAWSWNLCHIRSISPVFGIMEQQSGPNGAYGGGLGASSPKPGQLRLWSMQSLAHGADYISYFRWRTSRLGTEIYWHGILDQNNRDTRRLAEVKQVSKDLEKLACVKGTDYEAEVAIAFDYLDDWDSENDGWHGPVGRKSQDSWFDAMQKAHIPCDFVYFSDDCTAESLRRYKLIVFPDAAIVTEMASELLHDYVREGGTLVIGPLTGYKDENGLVPMTDAPGPLRDLAGGITDEYTFVSRYDDEPEVDLNGTAVPAPLFNEILIPETADVIGTYRDGVWYEGKPAVTRNRFGEGVCIKCGSAFSEEAVLSVLESEGIASPLSGRVDAPQSVEAAVRGGVLFLLNYLGAPAEIKVSGKANDLLSGDTLSGTVTIPPYGVLALRDWQ